MSEDNNSYENGKINSSNSHQDFISDNISYQTPKNTDNLEKNLSKNIIYEKKIIGPYNLNKKINNINTSNSNDSINKEEFSDEISQQSQDITFEPNKLNSPKNNYINDSDNESDDNNGKGNGNKRIIIRREESSLRTIPLNYNYNSQNNSENKFSSRKDLISSLKNGNISPSRRYSIIQNIPKLTSILSLRNTLSNKEKPRFLSISYFFPNRDGSNFKKSEKNTKKKKIIDKNSVNYDEQAKIIQNWYRNIKSLLNEKVKKIIKIQSVWRGKYSRKYFYDIIGLCVICHKFYDIMLSVLTHNIRAFVWNYLFPKNNTENDKLLRFKKLIYKSKYNLVNPFFQRWKCISKILFYRNKFNKKKYIFKKIKIVNRKDLLSKYFKKWEKSVIINKFLNNVRNNIHQNIYNNIYNYNDNFRRSINNLVNIYNNKDNNYLKKYYFFKWRNIVKNMKFYNLRRKLLIYIINNISRKSIYNTKYKYFSRWKLLTDDYLNKINNLRKNNNIKRRNNLIRLINITFNIRDDNYIYLRELIRKWRFLVFGKKMARDKMLKMYEIMQKNLQKMNEEMYDFDKKKEEKYNILNNNNIEGENEFVENMNKLYNSKNNQKFKFKYNIKK